MCTIDCATAARSNRISEKLERQKEVALAAAEAAEAAEAAAKAAIRKDARPSRRANGVARGANHVRWASSSCAEQARLICALPSVASPGAAKHISTEQAQMLADRRCAEPASPAERAAPPEAPPVIEVAISPEKTLIALPSAEPRLAKLASRRGDNFFFGSPAGAGAPVSPNHGPRRLPAIRRAMSHVDRMREAEMIANAWMP